MQARSIALTLACALAAAAAACSGTTAGPAADDPNAGSNPNGNANANDPTACAAPYVSQERLTWATPPTPVGTACEEPEPERVFDTPAGAASVRPASAARQLWWNGAVVYQIWTRSFRDAASDDGIGDLAGVAERIPYLKDLGVDALWLSPIFPSPSYHGYDVTSYDDVKAEYDPRWATGGTNPDSDLDRMIAAAHAAGLKVILDFVPNHVSIQHPWFQEAIGGQGKRDWFVWRDADPGWGVPWGGSTPTWHALDGAWYYAAFWEGMPDLNWTHPEVQQAMADAAVRWLRRGVDGFRLDAIRYLVETGPGAGQADTPETHAALRGLVAAIRAEKPDALVYGEAWTPELAGQAPYLGSAGSQASGGDEVLPLDFALASALSGGNPAHIARALDQLAAVYPAGAADAPFLTNHDQVRTATVLQGDRERIKAAATLLLTLQGTPVVYYGEELGAQNGPGSADEAKRTPMAWDACALHGFTAARDPWNAFGPGAESANVVSEAADPGSVLVRYRQLLALRHASPALRAGGTTRLATDAASDGWSSIVAFLRTDGEGTVLVAVNLAPVAVRQSLALDASAADPLLLDDCAALQRSGGTWSVTLGPRASGIWRLAR